MRCIFALMAPSHPIIIMMPDRSPIDQILQRVPTNTSGCRRHVYLGTLFLGRPSVGGQTQPRNARKSSTNMQWKVHSQPPPMAAGFLIYAVDVGSARLFVMRASASSREGMAGLLSTFVSSVHCIPGFFSSTCTATSSGTHIVVSYVPGNAFQVTARMCVSVG